MHVRAVDSLLTEQTEQAVVVDFGRGVAARELGISLPMEDGVLLFVDFGICIAGMLASRDFGGGRLDAWSVFDDEIGRFG